MNYNIIATPRFKRELKRLVKKFRSLKKEYAALVEKQEQNPIIGDPLGHDCNKVRLAIAAKGSQRKRQKWWGQGDYACGSERQYRVLNVYLR